MARKRSEFLKGFGKAFEIFKALTDAVLERGGDDGDIERILTSKILRANLADIICNVSQTAKNTFRVLVNYSHTVEEMVRVGKYDRSNSNINSENFPTDRDGAAEVEVELVHLNRVISDGDEAVRELDRMGYRPAELHELLALGEQRPEVQREFPIAALGSVWRFWSGDRVVAYLCRVGSERELGLRWFDGSWGAVWRFAAVRK